MCAEKYWARQAGPCRGISLSEERSALFERNGAVLPVVFFDFSPGPSCVATGPGGLEERLQSGQRALIRRTLAVSSCHAVHLMDAGDAGQAIPVVCSPFAPAIKPFLAKRRVVGRAGILGATGDAGQITPFECP